ncbi:YqzE family protein [Alteribacillus bidgolensis]|uniref:YqzE family protein n=1 Tax=Alteribacillus bidgolensis TaxID=930129 RepID=UPI0011137EF3
MTPHPFVKYLTQQIVEALDNRVTQKSKVSTSKNLNNFWTRWFGMLPYSISVTLRKMKRIRN